MKRIILILLVFLALFSNGAKVIIDLGQSNASGRGDTAQLSIQYKQALPEVQVFNGTIFVDLDYSTNSNQYPEQTGQGDSGFSRDVALANYFGETIYRIKYAVGSTYLASNQPNGWYTWNVSTQGQMFDKATTTVNNALAYMWNTLGIRHFDFYIFWKQGCADALGASYEAAYETNLLNCLNGFLDNLSGTSCAYSKNVIVISRVDTLIVSVGTDAVITGATNATPIKITTQTNHNKVTGQSVLVSGVTGNTAANGRWNLTYVSGNTFTLDGSVGNGNYISGGACNYTCYASEISTDQKNVVLLLNTSYSIPTYTYPLNPADGVHFTMAGLESLGTAEANVIISNGL